MFSILSRSYKSNAIGLEKGMRRNEKITERPSEVATLEVVLGGSDSIQMIDFPSSSYFYLV